MSVIAHTVWVTPNCERVDDLVIKSTTNNPTRFEPRKFERQSLVALFQTVVQALADGINSCSHLRIIIQAADVIREFELVLSQSWK